MVGSKNPVSSIMNVFGGGGNTRATLSRRQRQSFRETQRIWLEMALKIINAAPLSQPVVLGVTSTIKGGGKTTNCVGIASAISKETDDKVLLIECDFIDPSLASLLDLNPEKGLIEAIQNGESVVSTDDIVQPTPLPNLDIVVAGLKAENEAADGLDQPLLSVLRRRLPNILTSFKQTYRYIMLDLPPLLSSPYSRELVSFTDGTFLAVRAGTTPTEGLIDASDLIGEDKFSGVILIGSDSPLPKWLVSILES